MWYLVFAFWLLTAVFGNKFLKFSIMGINPVYALIGFGILCFIYFFFMKKIKIKTDFNENGTYLVKKLYTSAFIYFVYNVLIIIFSYLNLYSVFEESGFEYKSYFVLRQSYFIFLIPFICVLVYCLYSKGLPKFIFDKPVIVITVLILFSLRMLNYASGNADTYVNAITVGPFIICLATYYAVMYKGIFPKLIFIIAGLTTQISQTAYIIGFLLICVFMIFEKQFLRLLSKNLTFKVYAVIVVLVVAVIIGFDYISGLVANDANTQWRFQYWMHEIGILVNTYFIGVGYGMPYGSEHLFSEINNPYCFVVANDGMAIQADVLYVVPQHNSIINQFYRLGLIGGILFINIIINICKLSFNDIKNKTGYEKNLVKWGFLNFLYNLVIIIFNPGLESPKFMFGMLFSTAILIGSILHINKQNTELSAEVYAAV